MSVQKLPNEIILAIFEEALAVDHNDAILPASHIFTKTCLTFTRVCWVTYYPASEYLWRRCLYIDSAQRATDFLHSLNTTSLARFLQPGIPARLFMSPFPLDYDEEGRAMLEQIWANLGDSSSEDGTGAVIEILPEAEDGSSEAPPHPSPLNSVPTATAVMEIFQLLAPVLTSLVVDMPLRTLYPDDDAQGVRPILRRGFEALVNVEELVSVRDELYLATLPDSFRFQPEVWSHWPKLRRLALYNPVLDSQDQTWKDLANALNLETVVFTRSDPGGVLGEINMKTEWHLALMQTSFQRNVRLEQDIRPLTLALVDCPKLLPSFSQYLEDWQAIDPTNEFRIITKSPDLPASVSNADGDEPEEISPIEICQDWIKEQALNGSLWKEVASGRDWGRPPTV